MPLLDKYSTEAEVVEELRQKTGKGSKRQLRGWRAQQIGPAWRRLGKIIIYPHREFEEWLRDGIVQPARPRRASSRGR